MSDERKQHLEMLKRTLTPDQLAALVMVIQTAEAQGGYNWNGEDSVHEDDVALTLNQLAAEFATVDKLLEGQASHHEISIGMAASECGLEVQSLEMKPIYGSIWRWVTGRPMTWIMSYHFTFKGDQ